MDVKTLWKRGGVKKLGCGTPVMFNSRNVG